MRKKPQRLLLPDDGGGNSTAGASQADTSATNSTPQAGGQTTSSMPQAGGDPTTTTSQKSSDDYERMIAELRKENASHRVKAKELDELKARLESEKLSESEKLQKQLADYQARESDLTRQLQEHRVRSAVFAQASALSIIDVDAAAKLLDWSEIDYDGNGNPTNVDTLLKQLVKAKPYLVNQQQQQRQAPTSGGATNPSRSTTTSPQALTKDYIAKLTPADYAAMTPEQKLEISRWIANGGMSRHR